jgi:hypothetical protein
MDRCRRVFQAAVNVGRVCRHIFEQQLLYPMLLPFNVWHKRERCRIRITHSCGA